jgi:hypothetical protein
MKMHIICPLQCVKRSCYFYSASPWFKDHYKQQPFSESLKRGNLFQLSYELLGEIDTVVLWVMNVVVLNVDTNIPTVIYTVYV